MLFLSFSCSTKKDIILFQDFNSNDSISNIYDQYKLKVDDILKIEIKTEMPDDEILKSTTPNIYANQSSDISFQYYGYQIDANGFINFVPLGKIYVKGYTISEISDIISNKIIDSGILIKPVVDIKLINSNVTVLGEVNNPGSHKFIQSNFNILEAIGLSGGLTINAKRDDVRIIREINNERIVLKIDLTNNIINDPHYQILPGDIIIVNPNSARVKNAGIIGNSGTLLSLLSFILSSIIVISNS